MTPPLLSSTLPAPIGDTATPSGLLNSGRDPGWQQAMEKAQAQQWLNHGPLKSSSPMAASPASALNSPMPSAPFLAPLMFMNVRETLAVDTAIPKALKNQATVLPEQASSLATNTGSNPGTNTASYSPWTTQATNPLTTGLDLPNEVYVQAIQTLARKKIQRPPVRVHLEKSGDTARVWLGVDGQDEALINQLAQQVRSWLEQQGMHAITIVCNGIEVGE